MYHRNIISTGTQDELVELIYNMNQYVYIYSLWLVYRWHPLQAEYNNRLPKNIQYNFLGVSNKPT